MSRFPRRYPRDERRPRRSQPAGIIRTTPPVVVEPAKALAAAPVPAPARAHPLEQPVIIGLVILIAGLAVYIMES